MTDEERRSYANLLLLCYRHHVETNDPSEYPATALHKMKRDHDARFATTRIQVSEDVVAAVASEAAALWLRVDLANRHEHIAPGHRVPIDVTATPLALFDRLHASLARLAEMHDVLSDSAEALPTEVGAALERCGYDLAAWSAIRYWENPTINRDWELARPEERANRPSRFA